MNWYVAVGIAVTEKQLHLVRNILTRIVPDADCFAFGSRLGAHHHRYSDLDVAVRAARPIPLAALSELEEAFAESDLPFRVDVVDLHRASPEFQRLVEARHIRI